MCFIRWAIQFSCMALFLCRQLNLRFQILRSGRDDQTVESYEFADSRRKANAMGGFAIEPAIRDFRSPNSPLANPRIPVIYHPIPIPQIYGEGTDHGRDTHDHWPPRPQCPRAPSGFARQLPAVASLR